jgi:(E)-4-hydroxy-3-methylbut-2-enyl-diphosphate synthase
MQSPSDLAQLQAKAAAGALPQMPGFLIVDLGQSIGADELDAFLAGRPDARHPIVVLRRFGGAEAVLLATMAAVVRSRGCFLACDLAPRELDALGPTLQALGGERLLFTYSGGPGSPDFEPGAGHALGAYRRIAARLGVLGLGAPIWIRNTAATAVRDDRTSLSNLIEASFLCGALLCDGIGDLVSIETEPDPDRSLRLAYNLLQGAGTRISKTEFVACPSCGRRRSASARRRAT